MIYKAYKVQVQPNNKQESLLLQNIGCARWTYNWALSLKKEAFDKKEKIPSFIDLGKNLTILKKTELSWMFKSSSYIPQNALKDCDKAFQNFFIRCKKKVKGKKGFPKFKSKRNEKQSFRVDDSMSFSNSYKITPPRAD